MHLVFFYDLKFKIIKINDFNKIILRKPHFGKSLEIGYISIQPDGGRQVKFVADLFQASKDFFGPCGAGVVADNDAFQDMCIFIGGSH